MLQLRLLRWVRFRRCLTSRPSPASLSLCKWHEGMRTTLELSLEALYVSRGDPITAIYTAKRLDQNGLRSGVVVVVEPSVEAVKLRAWKDQFDERLAAFLPIAAVVEIIYITPATAMKLFSESARAAFAIHPALERLDGIVQQTQYQ